MYGGSCNKKESLGLSDSCFINTVHALWSFLDKFEIENSVAFSGERHRNNSTWKFHNDTRCALPALHNDHRVIYRASPEKYRSLSLRSFLEPWVRIPATITLLLEGKLFNMMTPFRMTAVVGPGSKNGRTPVAKRTADDRCSLDRFTSLNGGFSCCGGKRALSATQAL